MPSPPRGEVALFGSQRLRSRTFARPRPLACSGYLVAGPAVAAIDTEASEEQGTTEQENARAALVAETKPMAKDIDQLRTAQ
jgi:hypothetical protein